MIALSAFVTVCLVVALPVLAAISIALVAFLLSVASDIRAARRERQRAQRKRAVEDATGRDL